MKQATARIRQLQQLDASHAEVHLDCPPPVRPGPGQFLLADTGGYLLRPIFPRRLEPEGFSFATDLAATPRLQPGSPLDLLGPIGSRSRPPHSGRNLLLIHAAPGPLRLLPVALDYMAHAGAVTLLLPSPDGLPGPALAGLPNEFEILRGPREPHLPDALAWADAIYADTPADQLNFLRQTLTQARPCARSVPAYALLTPPMPCGVGACGICAIHTRKGWKHACTDGPLFPMEDL